MNSQDEARHSSLLETKTFCDLKNAIWNTEPSFTSDYGLYTNKLVNIADQKQKSNAILIGFTVDKINKEGLLITDLLFIMPRIQTWASPTNNNRPDVKAAATMPESLLPRLQDTILLDKAKSIQQLMADNPTIVPGFVTALRQTSFGQNITNYEGVVEMPETKIDERAAATTLMVTGVKDAMKFRKDLLLTDAKFFRETEPNFFLGFKQSMKVDDNPSSKLSFKGDVKEEGTDLPVPNVTILIADLAVTKKTGEKGNFIFKSLPAGQYTVVFMKFGYETLQKTVFINAGERTDLSVKLTKVVV